MSDARVIEGYGKDENTTIAFGGVICSGYEAHLNMCSKFILPNSECNPAGVTCVKSSSKTLIPQCFPAHIYISMLCSRS